VQVVFEHFLRVWLEDEVGDAIGADRGGHDHLVRSRLAQFRFGGNLIGPRNDRQLRVERTTAEDDENVRRVARKHRRDNGSPLDMGVAQSILFGRVAFEKAISGFADEFDLGVFVVDDDERRSRGMQFGR